MRPYPEPRSVGIERRVNSATRFLRTNAAPIVIGVALLIAVSLVFPYVLGLHASIGIVLFLITVGTTLGFYRLLNRSAVAWGHPLSRTKLAVSGVAGLVVVAFAIQTVPYGWNRSNPPVTAEPAWDSARTRELTVRACFDCHSNEVDYPWYSGIAPMSWAVQLHVEQGRGEVNYSEWDLPQREGDESAETVIEGEMPPAYYTLLTHSAARLTDAEREELIDGLDATLGTDDADDGHDDRDERDDD
jgi:hypothetical protein